MVISCLTGLVTDSPIIIRFCFNRTNVNYLVDTNKNKDNLLVYINKINVNLLVDTYRLGYSRKMELVQFQLL